MANQRYNLGFNICLFNLKYFLEFCWYIWKRSDNEKRRRLLVVVRQSFGEGSINSGYLRKRKSNLKNSLRVQKTKTIYMKIKEDFLVNRKLTTIFNYTKHEKIEKTFYIDYFGIILLTFYLNIVL
jgi:capsule polysaccharide export protein KpsC/LpsZ